MRFDRSGFVSSTPQILGGNAPLVSFQGSGSFLPLQPLEPSEGNNAKISTHGSNGHALPSSLQQAAAAILQDFDDAKIFNCLSVLRSLSPEYLQSSHSEGLSIQQLTALSTLKDCRNDDIAACLEASRRSRGSESYSLRRGLTKLSRGRGQLSGSTWKRRLWSPPSHGNLVPRILARLLNLTDRTVRWPFWSAFFLR